MRARGSGRRRSEGLSRAQVTKSLCWPAMGCVQGHQAVMEGLEEHGQLCEGRLEAQRTGRGPGRNQERWWVWICSRRAMEP